MNVDSPVIPCCPRIYWRECRKNRRPRNWDSLPCLRLQPHNRILFICRRCGFGNTFGTTCPWCSRICEETTSCINSTPRIRRISCPSLLTDAQKAQLERIEEVTNHTRRDYCQVPNLTSVGQGNPGASQIVDGPSDVAASGLKRSAATPSTKIVRRKRHRNAAVYSAMDVVATGTASTELQPFLSQVAKAYEKNGGPTSFGSPSPAASALLVPMDTHLTNPTTEDGHEDGTSCMISMTTVSQRTLRRKQRISVLRQRSTCSLRRRAPLSPSMTPLRRMEPPKRITTPDSVKEEAKSTVPSLFPTDSPIPLGHPARPLYTAIRKNMLPSPNITCGSIRSGDHTSFHATVLDRGSKSLDIPRPSVSSHRDLDLRSETRYHYYPTSASALGCSLSGETEMRMNLARRRSMDGAPSDYKFHEVRRGGLVRDKVKNLGRGLKDLLLKRT